MKSAAPVNLQTDLNNRTRVWNFSLQQCFSEAPPSSKNLVNNFTEKNYLELIINKTSDYLMISGFASDELDLTIIQNNLSNEIIEKAMQSKSLTIYKNNKEFRNYLNGILLDLFKKSEQHSDHFIKNRAFFYFQDQSVDKSLDMLTLSTAYRAKQLGINKYSFDQKYFLDLRKWAEKNKILEEKLHLSTTKVVRLHGKIHTTKKNKPLGYQLKKIKNETNFFHGIVFIGILFSILSPIPYLSGIVDSTTGIVLNILMAMTSVFLLVIGSKLSSKTNSIIDIQIENWIKGAQNYIDLEIKEPKKENNFVLAINFVIKPIAYIDYNMPPRPKEMRPIDYKRLLQATSSKNDTPSLQLPAPISLSVSEEKIEPLKRIDDYHIQFWHNNVTYDAYLIKEKLPADVNGEAVQKAFQKGLFSSSKNRSAHAIVLSDKKFMIRIPGKGRMVSTMENIDEKNKKIVFDAYDPNHHVHGRKINH